MRSRTLSPWSALLLCGLALDLHSQNQLDRVPIQYRPPTLVVDARVNGSKPLLFAFDTGSTTCLIDAQVARRLGIQPVSRPGRTGPGFARARTLAVGRATAHDLELVIRDLSPLSQQLGLELAGIIGFTWMEQFVFEIDYREKRLTLWPRTAELIPRADQLPLPLELHSAPGFTGASLYVPVTLDGRRGLAEIDSGAATAVLGRTLAARLGATINPINAPQGLPTHTVTRMEFAGRRFANVSFVVDPRLGSGSSPYGQCVIGNELLKAFVVTFDIPRRRVFFQSVLPPPD